MLVLTYQCIEDCNIESPMWGIYAKWFTGLPPYYKFSWRSYSSCWDHGGQAIPPVRYWSSDLTSLKSLYTVTCIGVIVLQWSLIRQTCGGKMRRRLSSDRSTHKSHKSDLNCCYLVISNYLLFLILKGRSDWGSWWMGQIQALTTLGFFGLDQFRPKEQYAQRQTKR